MDEIELTNSHQQARNLQKLHDEEQSFLRSNGDGSNEYNDDYEEVEDEGYEYPQQQSDYSVLCTAWSRLSCPTRFILFMLFSVASFYGVYNLGLDEGVREEHHFLNGSKRSGGGGNQGFKSGTEANEHYQQLQNAFTPELLHNTRKASKELIELLHDYYGGEDKARDMLMRSWQAGWELDVGLFLSGDESISNEDGTEKSAADEGADDDDDNTDDDDNLDDKAKKRQKRKKKKRHNNSNGRELKKGKVVKALNDPSDMNAAEKQRWHVAKRERVTKLITTMARALLNPNQSSFMIGTIGR